MDIETMIKEHGRRIMQLEIQSQDIVRKVDAAEVRREYIDRRFDAIEKKISAFDRNVAWLIKLLVVEFFIAAAAGVWKLVIATPPIN